MVAVWLDRLVGRHCFHSWPIWSSVCCSVVHGAKMAQIPGYKIIRIVRVVGPIEHGCNRLPPTGWFSTWLTWIEIKLSNLAAHQDSRLFFSIVATHSQLFVGHFCPWLCLSGNIDATAVPCELWHDSAITILLTPLQVFLLKTFQYLLRVNPKREYWSKKKKAVKDRTPFDKCNCVLIIPPNTKTLLKPNLNHWWGQSITQLLLYYCCSFRSTTSKNIITIIIICICHLSTLNTQWMSGMIGYHAMIHWFELWPLHCLPTLLSHHLLSHCAIHKGHATPHRKSMKGSAQVAASGLTVHPSPCFTSHWFIG